MDEGSGWLSQEVPATSLQNPVARSSEPLGVLFALTCWGYIPPSLSLNPYVIPIASIAAY